MSWTKRKVYQLFARDKCAGEMLPLGQGPLFTKLTMMQNLFLFVFEQLDVDGGRPGNKVIELPS